MTDHKHLKARVRARMAKTGERYAAARAHVVAAGSGGDPAAPPDGNVLHLVGPDPETTGLRILLAHAGIVERDGRPLDDATVLAIGGGIGLGVFAFHYAKEGFSSFHLAGRHRWDDGAAYVAGVAERLGLELETAETTSATVAERRLRAALEHGPALVWVDAVELGTRGIPLEMSGGGYHSVVVHRIDDDAGTALVSDLAAAPVTIPLDVLARARARIAKQRNRVIRIVDGPATGGSVDLLAATRAGLRATLEGFAAPRTRNFSLDALGDWATRLRGTGTDSWARIFPPGEWRLAGLAAIHAGIEHQGSGGGLVRPRFARALRAASERLRAPALLDAADRYEQLGALWTELARAAVPDAVPLLRRRREAEDRLAAAFVAGAVGAGPPPHSAVVAAQAEIETLRHEAIRAFPQDERDAAAHASELADRVERLHRAELDALDALRTGVSSLPG